MAKKTKKNSIDKNIYSMLDREDKKNYIKAVDKMYSNAEIKLTPYGKKVAKRKAVKKKGAL